jgi:hypothetical protein
MIPRGIIYSELRSKMVGNFPEGSKAVYGDSTTVGEWLSTGSLVVKASTKSKVAFEAPIVEFGSSLLTEIENLLNHCFEHLQELVCVSQDTRVRSEAWNTVTAYYFAFFSASALLRLLGRPVVFLNRDQLHSFPKLLGSGVAPNQGAFEIQCVSLISSTHAEFSLQPTNKVHEATWQRLLGLLEEIQRSLVPKPEAREALFYASLSTKVLFSRYVNYQWPSSVRNLANYRPGFAYKLQTSRSANLKLISEWVQTGSQESSQILKRMVSACHSDIENFDTHVKLLTALGVSLFLLSRELYSDLLTRKTLDKRWEHNRRSYRAKMCLPGEKFKVLAKTF